MDQNITKNDLFEFKDLLVKEIRDFLQHDKLITDKKDEEFLWLRSKAVRSLLNISPATLQNLRITGKIRYRKILGSYYYNKEDLMKLFSED
ncbi:helix-turn-helix domain-containing protein [Sphingobacterium bovistauri]|uniref:Helix-turn-helix domain-containing protein n=1 Tax=Sphingobacterium bovistauri TaxID=2781959 RepID=A0ABS7Z9C7_9SPHI|nr:helix-turn-helix domain-containing protein [Sphingobacterium bovistauri]MCA5006162.1 helix-turn-helix domain-containing protein [Sphingobacterium bovistauri]